MCMYFFRGDFSGGTGWCLGVQIPSVFINYPNTKRIKNKCKNYLIIIMLLHSLVFYVNRTKYEVVEMRYINDSEKLNSRFHFLKY